jgi:hypothetical protein
VSTFEIGSIFPTNISDDEDRPGFTSLALNLDGFSIGTATGTRMIVVGRQISPSDMLLKMNFNNSICYRHLRYGHKKVLGLRLGKPKWHAVPDELYIIPAPA